MNSLGKSSFETSLKKRHPFHLRETPLTANSLLRQLEKTAFNGRMLGEALTLWDKMIEEDCFIIFGFAASMSSAGMWPIVCQLMEHHYIDAVVSTGANITEDVYEAMGSCYSQVDPYDPQDKRLYEEGLDRFLDHVANDDDYVKMEKLLMRFLQSLDLDKVYNNLELMKCYGKFLEKRFIKSIASQAYQCKIPLCVPALVDSGFGVAYDLLQAKQRVPVIDAMNDFARFTTLCEHAQKEGRKTACIFIGGGVPKDYIQIVTTSLAARKDSETNAIGCPHSYSIQLTTDNPFYGGLGGATLGQECLSWGKETEGSKNNVMVYVDATIGFPLLSQGLLEGRQYKTRLTQRSSYPYSFIDFEAEGT